MYLFSHVFRGRLKQPCQISGFFPYENAQFLRIIPSYCTILDGLYKSSIINLFIFHVTTIRYILFIQDF